MEFDFTDHGSSARLAAALVRHSMAAGVKAHKAVTHWGALLQTGVKAGASGRPGPRAPTGDYRRSIALTTSTSRGGVSASVGTNKPQGRRLEFGFKGADSLGRSYDQAPLPHFGPAFDKIAPKFQAAIAAISDIDDKDSP